MSVFTTWSDFELYAQLHEEDLKMLYKRLAKRELMNYTPSHDTFSYCFRGLDPKALRGLQVLAAHCLGDPRATYLHRWKNNPRGEEA